MRVPSVQRILLVAVLGLIAVLVGSAAEADVVSTPNTYRADFSLGGGLSLTRADARFVVGPDDHLVSGEKFAFTLFDAPGVVVDSKEFEAGFDTGFFIVQFDLGPGELTDGIGFVQLKGLVGAFDLAGGFIHGVRTDGESSPERELTFALVTATPTPPGPTTPSVPAPASGGLVAAGLGLLGWVARRRRASAGR